MNSTLFEKLAGILFIILLLGLVVFIWGGIIFGFRESLKKAPKEVVSAMRSEIKDAAIENCETVLEFKGKTNSVDRHGNTMNDWLSLFCSLNDGDVAKVKEAMKL